MSQKNAVFDAMLGYFEGEMPAGFEHGDVDREFSSYDGDHGLVDEYSIRIRTPDGIPGGARFFSFARSQPGVVNALASAGYSGEDIDERSFSRAYEGDGHAELYLSVPRALAGGVFSVSSPSELAKVLEREFGTEGPIRAGFRGWVLPDGTLVSVPEGGNHKSLARWIAGHVDYGGMRIPSTEGDGSPFVEDVIGGIRVNLDGEDYVRLGEKEPTRAQYDALRRVFGLGMAISLHFPHGDAGEGHSTAVETDPANGAGHYLRLIRRFHSSGEYPRDYESLSGKGLKEAKSLGGGDFGHRVKAWRVGKGDKGFYALDLGYYSHSMTGYRSGDARAVFLDLSGTKVFRPMREWGLYADTWAVIRRKNGDSSEFFEEKGVFYDEPYDGGEGFTDTDSLAQWGEENGYDAIVLEGIPWDQGYGPKFDEVYVANPEKVVVGRLSESTKVYGGIRMTESPYEVKAVLKSATEEIKVLHDPRKGLYLYGRAEDYIHNEMLEKAWEAGYYPELKRWELPEYEEKSDGKCLVYLWFVPGKDDGGKTLGVDDYTEEWVYPNGILLARSRYSETPLYDQSFELPKAMGKPEAVYVIEDWGADGPKKKRVDPSVLGESAPSNRKGESYLTEKTRQQLLDKSRNGAAYAPDNRSKGRNRYERRKYSKVAATIKDYNSIDMNAFFKGDYLEFGVPVRGETDDYVVTVTFERILPRLQQEVRSDRNRLSEKAVLRALLGAFNTGDVYVSCTCLHPDTRIKLLDGTNPTVAEMKERFDEGEKLYVYSTDGKGDFKPGEVEKVWVAKTARDFVKVTLDNGREILTTPDHPYMLRNGEYTEAKDLVPGTSLMPMHFNEVNGHADSIGHSNLNRKVAKVEMITLDDTPVYDIQVKGWHNFALDAGVVVHNCADFQFCGFNYLAVKQDYNSNPIFGKAMQPPTIRNPNDDKGAACKHILRVLSDVSWMMNVARVIYNYIKVSRELLQRNYAEIIFPKVYGRPYKGVVQMSLMDKDDMWGDALLQSDRRELDAVIAAAKQGRDVRGRFSQGNPYAFRKRDAQAGPTLSKGGEEDADDSGQPGDMHA